MNIAVLGSGAVGQALAKGFLSEGHKVWLATREPDGEKGSSLQTEVPGATITDFAGAASNGEIAVLCVHATALEDAINLAGPENLDGKVIIETTNIIKPEGDTMVYGGAGQSAAEQVQGWLPNSKVVKAFNTMGAGLMYKPDFGGELPTMFIAGDEAAAKKQVSDIASAFGWEPLDGGPLLASREIEAMALVWIRNSIANGRNHAFKML